MKWKKGTKVKKNEDGDTKIEEAEGTKTKIEGDGDAKIKNADGTKEKGTTTPTLSFNSKYDFVPGEKVVAYEDFNSAAIGDFPTRWNTNATAEVVTINNGEGKWLKIAKEGVFHPEFITNLPENITLEFDLGVNNDWNSNVLNLNIANLKSSDDFADYGYYVKWQGVHAVHLAFKPGVITSRSAGSSQLQAGKVATILLIIMWTLMFGIIVKIILLILLYRAKPSGFVFI
jgi:hypothetical protein